jgi:hypothetical protein
MDIGGGEFQVIIVGSSEGWVAGTGVSDMGTGAGVAWLQDTASMTKLIAARITTGNNFLIGIATPQFIKFG